MGGVCERMEATLTNAMVRCLLVIPCFRESERLPKFLPALVRAVEASGLDVRIRAVDDGSGAVEQAWLRDYVAGLAGQHGCLDPAQLNERNTGKGGAVYSGWERAEGAAVLAFVDADGAVPPEEVVRVLRMAVEDREGAVIAVRTGESGTRVVREMKRKGRSSAARKGVPSPRKGPSPSGRGRDVRRASAVSPVPERTAGSVPSGHSPRSRFSPPRKGRGGPRNSKRSRRAGGRAARWPARASPPGAWSENCAP